MTVIAVLGAISLLFVGSAALGSAQNQANVQQAEAAMTSFASNVNDGRAAALEAPDDGRLHVDESSRITVEVGTDTVLDSQLGAVVYEADGEQRVFEGGAVFAVSDGHASVLTRPPIHYEAAADHQTVVVDVVTVSGDVEDLETAGAPTERAFEPSTDGPAVQENVTVTVESEYADAWARYLEERTDATVDYDAAADRVEATFPVDPPADPVTVDDSYTVDGNVLLGGGVTIDSYDSRTATGAGSVGDGNYAETRNASVVATGGVSGAGSFQIWGEVYTGGALTLDGSATVHGNVYTTENVTIETPVEDVVVSGGTVTTQGGNGNVEAGAVVRAEEDFVENDYAVYEGEVHVGGDVDADGQWSTLESSGTLRAAGSVDFSGGNNGGTIDAGAAPPSTDELDRVTTASDSLPNASREVQEAIARYAGAPDPGIGGNNANDNLAAGDYYVDRDLTYAGSPSLTFDTTGGDVNLVVTGDVDAANLDATIVGDGRVNIYVQGNFETTGDPSWENSDGAGDRLWVYVADDSRNTDVQGDEFYGVVVSDSTVVLDGGTTLYGAVVTEGGDVNGGQTIYYDEALRDAAVDAGGSSGGTGPERTYVHVSRTEIGDDS